MTPPGNEGSARKALRQRLLAAREAFAAGPQGPATERAFNQHLERLLAQLEPDCLGLYWPVRGEFNPIGALAAPSLSNTAVALPYAQRQPKAMHYRAWDRKAPTGVDECGLPAAGGPALVPDVVLVPCVAFTRSGLRLGYGGGYFDRWLADHPEVTAVGVAAAWAEIDEPAFAAQPHDRRLTLVLTEHGVATD